MRGKTILLSPNGSIATRPIWDALKASNPGAWELNAYISDKFAITLRAFDRIHTDGTVPAEHWKRFEVETENIIRTDFEGRPLDKERRVIDIAASGTYRTLEEAQSAYRVFLARYTASFFDSETGEFREQGNFLNPDLPKVTESVSPELGALCGSW